MLRSKFFNYAQFSEARRRELNAQDFWTRVPIYNCFAGYLRPTPQKNFPRFSIWTQSDSLYFEEIFDQSQTSINPSNPHLPTPRWAQCHTVQGNWMHLATTLISCPPLVLSQGPWFPCLLSLRLQSRFWEHWIIGILWICQFASGTNKIMLCFHLEIHHHQCRLCSSSSCSNVSRTDTTSVEFPEMSWIFPHLNPAWPPYCAKDSATLSQEMHLLAQKGCRGKSRKSVMHQLPPSFRLAA